MPDYSESKEYPDVEADGHDEFLWVFEDPARELGQRLEFLEHQPDLVVDLGCREGALGEYLTSLYPNAHLIALDGSHELCIGAKQRLHRTNSFPVVSNLLNLPIKSNSVDLVVSNIAASFCPRRGFLTECYRVLRNDGVLMFSVLGARTAQRFRELLTNHGGISVDFDFPELHDLGDLLVASGFSNPVVDVESADCHHGSIDDLIHDLKNSEAFSAYVTNTKPTTTKEVKSSPTDDSGNPGRLDIPYTVDTIFGIAWKKQIDTTTAHVSFNPN